MGRKKTARTAKAAKPNNKPRLEPYAALLFGLGLFLLISFLFYSGKPADQEIIGLAGTYLVLGMEKLFGQGAALLPGIILLWSLHMFRRQKVWSKRMAGVVVLYLAVLVYFCLYRVPRGMEILEAARSGLAGGFVGGFLTLAVLKLFGNLGANLVMGLSFLAGIILIINRPLLELVRTVGNWLQGVIKTLDEMVFYEEETAPEPIIVNGPVSTPELSKPVPEVVEEPVIIEEQDRLPMIRRRTPHSDYNHPPLELLNVAEIERGFNKSDIKESIKTLEDTFNNFGIKIKVNQVSCGPSVTRYELQPAPGVKVSKILSLTDDLQLSMAARGIRIEAPIPGKSAVGIEVPNEKVSQVGLRNILSSSMFQEASHPLTVAMGEDISGSPVVTCLAEMPHLLIAGATGSGKSVCLNSLILSLLFKSSPQEMRLVLIDPKMVELTVFNGIPHLMAPVVTDPKKASLILRWMNTEMEKRYKSFSQEGVRDIYRYNEIAAERLPFIVIVIDELADLMMVSPVEVEDSICRLAQMARAAGIHLVVATQRPSVDVVTGVIKANIPSRVAFAVSSQSDSRTILDAGGAEKLLGRGDMLFFPVGSPKPLRVQGAYVSDAELERVVEFLREQVSHEELEVPSEWEASVDTDSFEQEDELFWDGVRAFVDSGRVSVSFLQRKLRIGYSRAARLVDMMEDRGIVSQPDVNKKRELLIDEEQLERLSSRREQGWN